jgi:hypothetical protein
MAITGEVAIPEIVGQDYYDIRYTVRFGFCGTITCVC